MGEFSPSTPSSSILVLGSSMNTVVTPCSGWSTCVRDLGAERVAVDLRGGLQVRHGNGDMVQAADHLVSFSRLSFPRKPRATTFNVGVTGLPGQAGQ